MKKTGNKLPKILIVDDEAPIRRTFKSVLELDYEVDEAPDGLECIAKCKKEVYSLIFLDIRMPRMDGMEVLEQLQEICPDTPIVMISGHGNIETAVEAVKKGAFDFIPKPLDLNRILITIRNALDKSVLVTENKTIRRKAMTQAPRIPEIVGTSAAIMRVKKEIDQAGPKDLARVLIIGPNGSGKELVARWVHERSPRKDGPFVEVNCAAIPSELIESTLFGHMKGSFTGAYNNQVGKFELANGGTLFLDEIGDMSVQAQAKVLRALQENKITRVGGDKDIKVDVRVVAATNKDLREEIRRNNFREDLFHRLAVIDIYVPALNERRDDIPQLAAYFMDMVSQDYNMKAKTFTPEAMEALKAINWTGNIRQLRNVIQKLTVFCENSKHITEDHILDYVTLRNASRQVHDYKELFDQFDTLTQLHEYIDSEFIKYKNRLIMIKQK
jgi:two-component system, NtrC family, nitrogen regulation response regulator NtrX